MRIVKLMPVAIILLSAGQLYASAPMRINFQGRLEESSEPVDGIKDFIFKIYDAESGGSLIWTSQSHSAMMTSGIFSIVLATGTPVNLSTATFAGPRYIEISVGGVVLNPRQEIVSAPYALVSQSLSADAKISLTNLETNPSSPSTINLSTNAVDWSQLKNVPVDFSDGVDNLGGGSIITKESGAIKVNPTDVLDFEGAQFNIADAGGGAAEISLEASSITLKGNTFNIAGKLLLLDDSGYVPDANLKSAIMVESENVSLLTNDANYLTSYTETDPIYIADEAYNITASSTTDWNAAHGWGDHSGAGYLTTVAGGDITAGTLGADVIISSVGVNGVRPGSIVAGAIVDADINASAAIAATKLQTTVMVESENVSLLTNDANYLTSGGAIILQDTLQDGATFYVSSGTVKEFYITDSITLPAASIKNADLFGSIDAAKITNTAAVLAANTFTGAQNYDSGASITAVTGQPGIIISTSVFIGGGANISTITAAGFIGNGSSLSGLTATQVGLGNVTNVAQLPSSYLDTDTGLTANSDAKVASQKATKAYVDSWTRHCVNPADANDIMVPVGDLCVDKYEASVWSTATGGTQYGIDGLADYPCGNGVTGTGQDCTPAGTPIYARSAVGYKPSTSLTWFQANIACANAGKHLLTNAEWQAAAAGTPDPGTGVASPGCKVDSLPDAASALTGERTACVSGYGVENMVGSVWEWVADWGQYGQISQATYIAWADGTSTTSQWPDAAYGADGSWNVAGKSSNGVAWVNGLPGSVLRGGPWGDGADAGVFAFDAYNGPSHWHSAFGFRCGRRR